MLHENGNSETFYITFDSCNFNQVRTRLEPALPAQNAALECDRVQTQSHALRQMLTAVLLHKLISRPSFISFAADYFVEQRRLAQHIALKLARNSRVNPVLLHFFPVRSFTFYYFKTITCTRCANIQGDYILRCGANICGS